MATRRKGQHDKYQDMLPLTTARGGLLTGFVPHDYWLHSNGIFPYQPCCQDVTGWQVVGSSRPLIAADPYRSLGYYHYVPLVRCGTCGTEQNAGEYVSTEVVE